MPALDQVSIGIWVQRFRRIYNGRAAELAAFSNAVAEDAAEVVTINRTSLEGQSSEGAITGNKMEILAACEQLLADTTFNPDAIRPAVARSRVILPDFRLCAP